MGPIFVKTKILYVNSDSLSSRDDRDLRVVNKVCWRRELKNDVMIWHQNDRAPFAASEGGMMTATSLAARPCPAIIGRRAHTGSNASCSAKRAARPRCRRASLRVRAADDPDPEPVPTDEGCRTIVITSGKGGVGKTTTSANLGMSIARLGYKVCLVDADIGLRNLDLLLGLENRVMYTAMEVLEGECRMEQALIRDKRWRSLALLPISKNRQKYNVTKDSMSLLIDILKDMNFQYIFIDCPAGIDVGFINAIAGANEAVIVTTPEITAIRDADRVAGLLEANDIYDVKLIVNRVRADMIKKNDMMSVKDVQEMLGVPLLGAIPEDTEVIVSTNRGEPLVLKKKLTLAGIAYENAARRVVGKQDFLIDLEQPKKGLLQRTKEFFTGSD